MDILTRLGLKKPTASDGVSGLRTAIRDNADALANAAMIGSSDTLPAASAHKGLYRDTTTGDWWFSDGSAWVFVSGTTAQVQGSASQAAGSSLTRLSVSGCKDPSGTNVWTVTSDTVVLPYGLYEVHAWFTLGSYVPGSFPGLVAIHGGGTWFPVRVEDGFARQQASAVVTSAGANQGVYFAAVAPTGGSMNVSLNRASIRRLGPQWS